MSREKRTDFAWRIAAGVTAVEGLLIYMLRPGSLRLTAIRVKMAETAMLSVGDCGGPRIE